MLQLSNTCLLCSGGRPHDSFWTEIHRQTTTTNFYSLQNKEVVLTCLYSDYLGDFSRHRHGTAPTPDRYRLLGHVGPVLRLLQHLLSLAVFVHCDRHYLFLQHRNPKRGQNPNIKATWNIVPGKLQVQKQWILTVLQRYFVALHLWTRSTLYFSVDATQCREINSSEENMSTLSCCISGILGFEVSLGRQSREKRYEKLQCERITYSLLELAPESPDFVG